MRFLKYSFWLAAWAVWLWLGFGLYRELPRELGPVVCKLPVATNSKLLGFVAETDSVAFLNPPLANKVLSRITVLNAKTGTTILDTLGPARGEIDELTMAGLLFGVFFENRTEELQSFSDAGLHVLSLTSGERRRLTTRPIMFASVHPWKPWVAVAMSNRGRAHEAATVIDFQTGKELFRREFENGGDILYEPLFIADENAVVLVTRGSRLVGGPIEATAEIWKIADPPVLMKSLKGLPRTFGSSISNDGRVIFGGGEIQTFGGGLAWSDVYDLKEGRFRRDGRSAISRGIIGRRTQAGSAILAPSGRTVLRGPPPSLVDIDTGVVLWHAESSLAKLLSIQQGVFRVHEDWASLWRSYFPSWRLETVSHRNIETGELLVRLWAPIVVSRPLINSNSTLIVLTNGAVHRLPLEHNWPLILLCQTILALPLVFLWLILLWRRRRIARRLLLQAAIP